MGAAFGVRPSAILLGDPLAAGLDAAAFQAITDARQKRVKALSKDGIVFPVVEV